MNRTLTDFVNRIASRRALVGIVGLGYVGLPLSMAFVGTGFCVLGFDTDAEHVAAIQSGQSYLSTVVSEKVESARKDDRFAATLDMGRLGEPDAICVCVPTPLTPSRDPDLSFVTSSALSIAATLRRGQLVSLESSTYPGTTREVMLPALQRSGFRCGEDFFLAYSPEREDPGNPDFNASNTPRLVAGLDPASHAAACALYETVAVSVVSVSSPEVAEAAKVVENSYRAVNIAFVNELKVIFDRMGIDVWEVLAAAATKPFGFGSRANKTLFLPGPGIGGHCIPLDPFYLAWRARQFGVPTRFIELAGEINQAMPSYVVQRIGEALTREGKAMRRSKVLILGVAYKPDINDVRESAAIRIIEQLVEAGAAVSYNDPHVPALPHMRAHRLNMSSVPLTEAVLRAQDAVVIVTDHSTYDFGWIVAHSRLVVDTRNACAGTDSGRIIKA